MQMGLQFGLDKADTCYKRKYRWLFIINDISASGVNSLPPLKSARPNISFKESEVQHLTETIYYAGKPEWKPVNLTLYDLKRNQHPVFEWLKKLYDPQQVVWKYNNISFKKNCKLELLDGCGAVMERWIFENAWPQTVEFGELDMSSSDIVTADITLRYDRAYIEY